MLSLLPSTFALGLAALAALLLVRSRRSPPEMEAERLAAARVLTLAVGIQSVHFAEEAVTGFHERFPALFDLPSMPLAFFVAFNVTELRIRKQRSLGGDSHSGF